VIGILFAGVDRQFFREVAGNPRQRGRAAGALSPFTRSSIQRGVPKTLRNERSETQQRRCLVSPKMRVLKPLIFGTLRAIVKALIRSAWPHLSDSMRLIYLSSSDTVFCYVAPGGI
jgi:hypothetical protein